MAGSENSKCRGLRWALIGSVTLNLLVAGVIVGGFVAHDRHPPRPVVGDVSLGAFTEALSPEDRDALRRAAQKRVGDFRDMRQAARTDMTALIAALQADPWNRAEVEQILARHKARTIERVDIGEALIFERLEEMTPEERRAFAERLLKGAQRFDKRLDRDDNRPPRP